MREKRVLTMQCITQKAIDLQKGKFHIRSPQTRAARRFKKGIHFAVKCAFVMDYCNDRHEMKAHSHFLDSP